MRTVNGSRRDSRRPRIFACMVAGVTLLGGALSAGAAPGDPTCLAKKLKEWGKLRKCEAVQNGKALRGQSSDPAKCRAKLEEKLATITAQATAAGTPCRFGVVGDGTLIDYDTGLQWEQKTDDGGLHDTDNEWEWSWGFYLPDYTAADGDLFTYFLASLNDCDSGDGATAHGGLGGHCDWRIPTLEEVLGATDPTVPGCGTLAGVCIDVDVFGPEHFAPNSPMYWTSTALLPSVDHPNYSWGVDLRTPNPYLAPRNLGSHARGVRSAL